MMVTTHREDLIRADQCAREEACRNFTTPLVLQAGAGTGKTAVLVSRLINYCLFEGWKRAEVDYHEEPAKRVIQELVAFTFTERAAAEMEERFRKWLVELSHNRRPIELTLVDSGEDEQTIAKRAKAVLAYADQLNIGTMHAFCHRLNRRYALERKNHPAGETIDANGLIVRKIVEENVDRWLDDAYSKVEKNHYIDLAIKGIDREIFVNVLFVLATKKIPSDSLLVDSYAAANWLPYQDFLKERLERFVEKLEPVIDKEAKGNLKSVRSAREELLELVEKARESTGFLDWITRYQGLELGSLLGRLSTWKKSGLTQTEAKVIGEWDELENSAEDLSREILHWKKADPILLNELLLALAPMLRDIYKQMEAKGVAVFSSLIPDAIALIEKSKRVQSELRSKIRQLVVDEFQDTDDLQCRLINLLALTERNNTPCGLMVVGDPKQSIYGWRGADLSAYERFVDEIEKRKGKRLVLSLNYRSDEPILSFVENIMSPIMCYEKGLQPPFAPLVATRDTEENVSSIEMWTLDPSDQDLVAKIYQDGPKPKKIPSDVIRKIEAKQLVVDLLERRQMGEPLSSCALLLRASTHQDIYVDALKAAKIPYVIENDRNYFRRREIVEAHALLEVASGYEATLSAIVVMRSPLAGVPDAALYGLWNKGFAEKLECLGLSPAEDEVLLKELEILLNEVAKQVRDIEGIERIAGWTEATFYVLCAIAECRRLFHVEPFYRWIERVRRYLPLETLHALRYLGSHRLSNLERFYQNAIDYVGSESGTFKEFLDQIKRDLKEKREEKEAPAGDEGLDALRVMTIHSAKGLTFDSVYLLGLHSEIGGRRGREKKGIEEWSLFEGQYEGNIFGLPTLNYNRYQKRAEMVSRAEEIRTLYVAMTRPKKRLVISGDFCQSVNASSHAYLMRSSADFRESIERLLNEKTHKKLSLGKHLSGCNLFREEKSLDSGLNTSVAIFERESARRNIIALEKSEPKTFYIESDKSVQPFFEQVNAKSLRRAACEVESEAEIAAASGTMIHYLFEILSDKTQLELLYQQNRPALEAICGLTKTEDVKHALLLVEELIKKLRNGDLLKRWRTLCPRIIGREVSLEQIDNGRLISSKIDMIYRDPQTNQPIIVDYKSDRVSKGEIDLSVEKYQRQMDIYRQGLFRAWNLSSIPKAELWFLSIDQYCSITS